MFFFPSTFSCTPLNVIRQSVGLLQREGEWERGGKKRKENGRKLEALAKKSRNQFETLPKDERVQSKLICAISVQF